MFIVPVLQDCSFNSLFLLDRCSWKFVVYIHR